MQLFLWQLNARSYGTSGAKRVAVAFTATSFAVPAENAAPIAIEAIILHVD
jgi:hypothetical protein